MLKIDVEDGVPLRESSLNRQAPYYIHTEDLVAFAVTRHLDKIGNHQISARDVARLLPLLSKRPDLLLKSSVAQVHEYFDALRAADYVLQYNPTFVTPSGEGFLREMVQSFRRQRAGAAEVLERALNEI
jgi:hypothetical protein